MKKFVAFLFVFALLFVFGGFAKATDYRRVALVQQVVVPTQKVVLAQDTYGHCGSTSALVGGYNQALVGGYGTQAVVGNYGVNRIVLGNDFGYGHNVNRVVLGNHYGAQAVVVRRVVQPVVVQKVVVQRQGVVGRVKQAIGRYLFGR